MLMVVNVLGYTDDELRHPTYQQKMTVHLTKGNEQHVRPQPLVRQHQPTQREAEDEVKKRST